ncbi:MAG: ribbon-helix-helix protein, CopG family [Nitrososphaerota archaeon]|nr:ribbon-helix-helix protein, CopG family [Nitrososphaerota archaeon]
MVRTGQLSIRLSDEEWKQFDQLKRDLGLSHDSEVIRYILRKALEALEFEKKAKDHALKARAATLR